MNKDIKEHEDINLHIKRQGILIGLLKLPFNFIICTIMYPFLFIIFYFKWYDGEKSYIYDSFYRYFYGVLDKELGMAHNKFRKEAKKIKEANLKAKQG